MTFKDKINSFSKCTGIEIEWQQLLYDYEKVKIVANSKAELKKVTSLLSKEHGLCAKIWV